MTRQLKAEFIVPVAGPGHIELVCCEVDIEMRSLLEMAPGHLERWLARRQVRGRYRIDAEDFLLSRGRSLQAGLFQTSMAAYDAIICNPPYFKVAKSDVRARPCSAVVHGQPNIYGLFMAVGAALLRTGGRFVFITPRSYASGPYFQRFRELFFRLLRPTDIHVFDSRKEAFSTVLQETVITAGTRLDGRDRTQKGMRIRLGSSIGADDIQRRMVRTSPLSSVLRGDCRRQVLHFPAGKPHDRACAVVQGWSGSLHAYGCEMSTGPVVAFRAKQYLRNHPGRDTLPLLWLQNVRSMDVRWPADTRKSQYLLACKGTDAIVVPNRNYVLLRRFSAKEEARRLTAAPLLASGIPGSRLGLENHLNYIHKPRGQLTVDEVYRLSALLNSSLLDTYARVSSGNTQVSATERRAMRLPGLDVIRRIGMRVRANPEDLERIVSAAAGYES